MKENSWFNFLSLLVSLKEVVVLVCKISVLVYNEILFELWKELKKANLFWNKNGNAIFFISILFFLFAIISTYLFRKKIYDEFLSKTKGGLKNFSKSVSDVAEELKRRRGGELNKSVLLYQVGSLKYGYERLGEDKQNDIYWISRTDQADRWTNWEVTREKLVDQLSHDFNSKRDEKKIRKYFRPIDELKRKLEQVDEEIKEIILKNLHERSESEQKRLEELFVDEKRLKTELYYSEMFFIVL